MSRKRIRNIKAQRTKWRAARRAYYQAKWTYRAVSDPMALSSEAIRRNFVRYFQKLGLTHIGRPPKAASKGGGNG